MFCTVGDTCAGGACGTPRDCSAAGDQCNNGVCNEAAGACEAQPKADSTSCNDGDACTTADHCSAGSCVGGPPPSCDDGNACTVDSCTAGSCVHVAISGDSDGDGYADCQENAAGCNPYDSTEIPLQADASLGVPTEGHRAGNRLVTYAAPPLHRRTIKVASEPSCATSGVCGGSGFCTAGKIGDPCTANAQCNQPANVCRLVVNFSKAPGLRIVDAKLNRQPVPGFTPVAPGCSRKVDVALNLAQRRSQRLRIKAVGTVGGRSQFDRDRFWYVR